jgi:hypothetical protein
VNSIRKAIVDSQDGCRSNIASRSDVASINSIYAELELGATRAGWFRDAKTPIWRSAPQGSHLS